jgi:hypothetical protein
MILLSFVATRIAINAPMFGRVEAEIPNQAGQSSKTAPLRRLCPAKFFAN